MLTGLRSRLAPLFEGKDPRKLVVFGNFLEFFDLYLYIHLAYIINEKFFPGGETVLLKAFPFFGFYVLAPMACIAFSYIGDLYGRKIILTGCSVAMAISSCLILFLPTYETAGVYPGYFLILLRVIQGISLAGEPTAASLYVIEATKNKRMFPLWATSLSVMECFGGALALGLCYIGMNWLSDYSWGWRLPLIGTTLFVFVSLIMRWFLIETPEYLKERYEKKGISMFSVDGVAEFYRSLKFKNRNVISLFFLWLPYPIIFVICYTYTLKLFTTIQTLSLRRFP